MSDHSIVVDRGFDEPHDWTAVCGGCGWTGSPVASEIEARTQYAAHLTADPIPSPLSPEEGRPERCPLLIDLADWVDAGEPSGPIHEHLHAPTIGPGHPGCGSCQLAVLRFRANAQIEGVS